MATRNRPLSPHIQIYRLPLLALISITHRGTGMVLSAGTLLLAYWLGSAAAGPEAFARASAFMGSPLGRLLLLGFSAALFYHLANGVRHLFWDAGFGFELPQAKASGIAVIAATILLTAAAWTAGLAL